MRKQDGYKRIRPEKIKNYIISCLIFGVILLVGIVGKMRFEREIFYGIITIAGFGELFTIVMIHKRAESRYYSNSIDEFIRNRQLLQYDIDNKGNEIIGYYP